MKKLLAMAISTGALAALAVDVATVGVTKIEKPPKNAIISVAYESLAGGLVSVHDLVKTTGLEEGTELYVFTNNTYCGYLLKNGAWEGMTTVGTDSRIGRFILAAGKDGDVLTHETAIWVNQQEPAPIVIYGAFVEPTNQTLKVGLNLVANPRQSEIDNLALLIDNPSKGDYIYVPQDDGNLKLYTYGKSGTWSHFNGAEFETGLPTIQAGSGFWYAARGSETAINWARKDY